MPTPSVQLDRVVVTGRRLPPNSDDVTLVVNGEAWGGWTSVRITRGIERLPSDFEVGLTEFAPAGNLDDGGDRIEILRGDTCVLMIGANPVVTGYVDRVVRSVDAKSHTVSIVGRSKCADLVDAAAEWPGGQIVGSSVLEIARSLARPYGITVSCNEDPGPPIPQFNLIRGETPFEIIERLCRFGQLLAYDDTGGNLVLARVQTLPTASGFAEGINVVRAAMMASIDQRYSVYEAYLQSVATLEDLGTGGDLIAKVGDSNVPRHRKRIIISETSGSVGQEIARARANWEMTRRRGRSTELRLTTDSWRDVAGTLYTPNRLARVQLPSLRIPDEALTIGEVTYRRDASSGTQCDLVLMPPDAFKPQPFDVNQLLPFAEMAGIASNSGRRN